MMRLSVAAAALLAVSACGGNGGVMQEIENAERAEARAAQGSADESAAFLERVRAQPGVEARPSGLLLEVRGRGADQSLPRPSGSAVVLVHYEGRLADGSVFDSSFARNQPSDFPLNAVVPGFSEAIQQMRPGDEVVATFPHQLGYGAEGRPPRIPPAAALQFRIVLLAFQEPNGQVVQAPR